MYSKTAKRLLSLLTVFAMVFGMIAMVQPMQANAATVETPISNGDFENGAFGGAVAGSNGASIVEKATYEGNYALKFDATGEILTVTGYLAEATTAESTVTLSFWAKVLAGSTQNSVNFGLFATNESWGNRVQKYGAVCPIVGGDWKQISQALAVPAGTKIIQAQIYLGAAGATAIVDNISITDGNGNEILQSGGFEKGALNGDFNANDALEIVCTPVHGGNYAAHADKTSGNGNISTTVSIEPSSEARTMEFSFWVYVPTGSTDSTSTMVACFDTSSGSWNNLSTKYGAQYARTFGQWVQKTMEIAVAPNTNTLQIQLYAQDTGADFYIDDLKLTEEVTQVNHDVTLTLNQVTGDGTWQFNVTSDSEIPTGYYKLPITADGVEMHVPIQYNGSLMIIYPNMFEAVFSGIVPQSSFVVAENTVLKKLNTNGWVEEEGADTLTITEGLDLSCVNGVWSKTVYTTEVSLSLSQVTGDGTWQFNVTSDSEIPTGYYKLPITADGVEMHVPIQYNGSLMIIYPNMFEAVFGGIVPQSSFVVTENTVLKKLNTNGWVEEEGADALMITEALDLSCVDGVWSVTVPNQDAAIEFGSVQNDGTWQFILRATPANKYYKVPAIIDGTACSFLMGESGGLMCVYPDFFTVGGSVPTESLVIEAGAVMKPVDSNNGWAVISGAETITLTNTLTIEKVLGSWQNMSQYADVTFTELKASDLNVYKAEDQSASQYRSVFAISSKVALGNAGWSNFTKVAAKVLVDGVETDVHFGMVPADDEGWGAESAFLLYIVGDGCWDAVSTANTITICAGTMIISPLDAAKGVVFTEDFVMYKNEDGSWDTTEDPTVEKQEISLSLRTVTNDGTWQIALTGEDIAAGYYKIPATIDGNACNVLAQYNGEILIIYPNFFPALGGAVPAESFVIADGAMLRAVDAGNSWAEINGQTPLMLTSELKIENIYGNWYEMSKYADLTFTEIYAADLELYYQNIMRLGDYSDAEVNMALAMYPQYKDLYNYYGRNANMTTFGIKSTIPTLQIPNDVHWSNFTLIGKVTVNGAEPWDTYVMQTPASGTDDSETAMDNAFLIRFYNGFVADQAVSVTIEPGTMIVTKDGTAGFVFVDGYTIYRGADGKWSADMPAGTNPVQSWGLILGENIGVKFQINTNEEVTFAVNGNTVAAVQDGNCYTISVAAAQMNDLITIYVGGVALEKTYTVRGYADIILADKLYGENTHNLIKAMLTYGGAAQVAFNYNAQNLASAGIEAEAKTPAGELALSVSGNASGIAFYGASLVHTSKTAVRFYFTAETMERLTFTVNGKSCEPTLKNGKYYVELGGINPQNLDDVVTAVVSDGTNSLTVTYSALDYLIRMYNKAETTAANKALVQALYGYYLAAEAYTA